MHIITESELEEICGCCEKKHDNHFTSIFDNHNIHSHYKIKTCENCGYEISFKTTDGSGIK